MILRDALAQHYVKHGLPADGGATSPTFRIRIGPIAIPLPNPPARKRAVFYHDTNHVLTGYNTVFSQGEMAIASFELGNGCGPFLIAWLINLGAFAAGLVLCPREMFRAFVRGRRASSVYERTEGAEVLGGMTVDALRAQLGLDAREAVPTFGDRLRFAAWAVAAALPLGALAAFVAVVALTGLSG